jgi:hypothetical protein
MPGSPAPPSQGNWLHRLQRSVRGHTCSLGGIYKEKAPDEVSWFEPIPKVSLELIEEAQIDHGTAVVDIGGGESHLAGELLSDAYTDITVADVSCATRSRGEAS